MAKTELIASYAAIISTLGIIWNFYLHCIDRGRFQVDASFGFRKYLPSGESEQCLFISITNIGRRPIMASVVEGTWEQARENGDQFPFIPPNDLPKLIKPGESHTEIYEKHLWCKIMTPDLKAIWVRDAVGKHWSVGKKNINNLITWGRIVNK